MSVNPRSSGGHTLCNNRRAQEWRCRPRSPWLQTAERNLCGEIDHHLLFTMIMSARQTRFGFLWDPRGVNCKQFRWYRMAAMMVQAGTREMLDRRYDDIKSGKVKLIPGEEAFARLHERIDARRSQPADASLCRSPGRVESDDRQSIHRRVPCRLPFQTDHGIELNWTRPPLGVPSIRRPPSIDSARRASAPSPKPSIIAALRGELPTGEVHCSPESETQAPSRASPERANR